MHKGTIDAYNRSADHWAGSRGRDSTVAAAFRALVGRGGLILDLGCGPGKLLADLGKPAIGVDASLAMLALAPAPAGRAGGLRLVGGDLEALPLREGCAAGAFGNFSYQHLPRAGFVRAVSEARRVLRAGGWLQLAMHAGDYEGDARPDDDIPGRWFTYWTPEPLREVLWSAGFGVTGVVDNGFSLRVTARRR